MLLAVVILAWGGYYKGATENAGVENVAPDSKGGKRGISDSLVYYQEMSIPIWIGLHEYGMSVDKEDI